jgi:hypothetical protein
LESVAVAYQYYIKVLVEEALALKRRQEDRSERKGCRLMTGEIKRTEVKVIADEKLKLCCVAVWLEGLRRKQIQIDK